MRAMPRLLTSVTLLAACCLAVLAAPGAQPAGAEQRGQLDDDLRGPAEALRADPDLLRVPESATPRRSGSGRAFLGVRPAPEVEGQSSGMVIEEVIGDSAAQKAGLRAGDKITALDGRQTSSFNDLARHIGDSSPGDEVRVSLRRGDKLLEIVVTLGGRSSGGGRRGGGLTLFQGSSFKLAVIPLAFSDCPPKIMANHEDLHRLFFGRGSYVGPAPGGVGQVFGSVRDYYAEVSCQRFDLDGRVFDWVHLQETKDAWRKKPLGSREARSRILNAAVEMVQQRHGKDILDAYDGIAFIHAGAQVVRRPSALWPHRASIRIGDRVLPYYLNAEGLETAGTIGVHCHEFGHVLGLPDQYGEEHRTGIGVFCVMGVGWRGGAGSGTARPFHLCAWCKIRLGWLEPVPLDPRVGQHLRLGPVEGSTVDCYKVVVRPGAREYFLLENRQRRGFDSHFPATGLLIWHLGESGQERRNRVSGHAIDLEEAHGLDLSDASLRDVLRIPFPRAGSRQFGPDTTPSSRSRTPAGLPVRIEDIREHPEDGSLTFKIIPPPAPAPSRSSGPW